MSFVINSIVNIPGGRLIGSAAHGYCCQVTGPQIVGRLLALAAAGVKVRLLVSSSIYGAADCKLANAAYAQIAGAAAVYLSFFSLPVLAFHRLSLRLDCPNRGLLPAAGSNPPISIYKTTRHYTYRWGRWC